MHEIFLHVLHSIYLQVQSLFLILSMYIYTYIHKCVYIFLNFISCKNDVWFIYLYKLLNLLIHLGPKQKYNKNKK